MAFVIVYRENRSQDNKMLIRNNYGTGQTMPAPTTTHHHPPPSTTTHNHPLPSTTIRHHPPPTTTITTTHHQPKYMTTTHYHSQPSISSHHQPKYIHRYLSLRKNGPPPYKSQNIFIYKLLLTFLWQCLFLQNLIFLSVTEILCDKVLISSFFKFQISTTFRSSHRRCSVRKGVLRNFAKFIGKHLTS